MSQDFQSAWPLPPSYLKKFSAEEITQLEPPPIPDEKNLQVFGIPIFETYRDQFEVLEKEIQTIYPKDTTNHKTELKKLNMSLLFNFMELIEVLVRAPSKYKKKVENIEQIMINMHHLLNTYRPHQARQMLIALMQDQIERRQRTVDLLDSKLTEADKMLEECTKKIEQMHEAVNNDTVDLRLSNDTLNNNTNNTNTSTHNNNMKPKNIRSSVHIHTIKKEVGHAENKHVKHIIEEDDTMQIDGEVNGQIKDNSNNNSNNMSSEEEKLKQEKLKREEEAKNYYKNLKLLRQSIKK